MMRTYPEICNSNKKLFAELEHITLLLSFCKAKHLQDEIDSLNNRRLALQELISIAIEELQQYWNIMDTTAREAKRKTNINNVLGNEKLVIEMFMQDRSQKPDKIAHKANMTVDRTNRIITRCLTQKYGEVA